MTTLDALLADILAHPDDDFPRLVYADYLDDHGRTEQAEFIRQQIRGESAEMNAQQFRDWLGCWADEQVQFIRDVTSNTAPGVWVGRCVFGSVSARSDLFWDRPGKVGLFLVCRGFIGRVLIPLATWLEYGRVIARSQPVRFVEINDREPYLSRNGLDYWRNADLDIHCLPIDLWRLTANPEDGKVRGYASQQEALGALSRACLEWAGVNEVIR